MSEPDYFDPQVILNAEVSDDYSSLMEFIGDDVELFHSCIDYIKSLPGNQSKHPSNLDILIRGAFSNFKADEGEDQAVFDKIKEDAKAISLHMLLNLIVLVLKNRKVEERPGFGSNYLRAMADTMFSHYNFRNKFNNECIDRDASLGSMLGAIACESVMSAVPLTDNQKQSISIIRDIFSEHAKGLYDRDFEANHSFMEKIWKNIIEKKLNNLPFAGRG